MRLARLSINLQQALKDFQILSLRPMRLLTNGFVKPFVSFCSTRKIGLGSYMGIIAHCCKFVLRGAAFRKVESICNRVKGFYAVFRESVAVNVQRG